MKCCTKCGEEKPLSEFAKNGKMGLHTSCKACQRAVARMARLADPEEARRKDKFAYEKRKEKKSLYAKAYYERKREERLAAEKARYAVKADSIKAAAKKYRESNPGKVRAWNNMRRAVCSRATPKWASFEAIAAVYELARKKTAESGVAHHVDHVVPLNGRNVCGLHTPDNLRVIEAGENLRKGRSLVS